MEDQQVPYFEDEDSKLEPDFPIVERPTINAILWDPHNDQVLCLNWEKFGWITFVVGGIEEGEEAVQAARREIEEETGYTNIELMANLGKIRSAYFAKHKNENRIAHTTGLLFKLVSDERPTIPDQSALPHVSEWAPRSDVSARLGISSQKYLWDKALSLLSPD